MEREVQNLTILIVIAWCFDKLRLARPTVSKAGENAELNMLMNETIPSEFEQFK